MGQLINRFLNADNIKNMFEGGRVTADSISSQQFLCNRFNVGEM